MRQALLASAVLTMAACARQDRSDVAVGIGTAAYTKDKAAGYAALYRPYAQMARLAYTDDSGRNIGAGAYGGPFCPNPDYLDDPKRASDASQVEANKTAAKWARQLHREGWRCLHGRVDLAQCPPGRRCVEGLEYHVWRRSDCTEAVIAFRGSGTRDIGDWISNLRWFIATPFYDHYEQVSDEIRDAVNDMYTPGCRPKRVIATGHSLGGGLAQHAAYASGRIGYVYAFDPSPVTGHLDVPWNERQVNEAKFGSDRVYESGEILSLPRYIASGVFPSPRCQPRVRIVRFATVPSSSLRERHRIASLTEGLMAIEPHPRPQRAKLQDDYDKARNCNFADGAS